MVGSGWMFLYQHLSLKINWTSCCQNSREGPALAAFSCIFHRGGPTAPAYICATFLQNEPWGSCPIQNTCVPVDFLLSIYRVNGPVCTLTASLIMLCITSHLDDPQSALSLAKVNPSGVSALSVLPEQPLSFPFRLPPGCLLNYVSWVPDVCLALLPLPHMFCIWVINSQRYNFLHWYLYGA